MGQKLLMSNEVIAEAAIQADAGIIWIPHNTPN